MSIKRIAILATSVAGFSAMAPTVAAQDLNVCSQESLIQIVYYGTGQSQLGGITSQIDGIQGLASSCDVRSIELVGHTDTVGSAAGNQRLSLKRANDMKAELVRRGVPADLITTVGRGESELFMPTADGVAEELNRRLQVNFTFNPMYVQSEQTYVQSEPTYVETYIEPTPEVYVQPEPVRVIESTPFVEPTPIVEATPVVQPAPVAQPAPMPVATPVAQAGNGLLVFGAAAAAAAGIIVVISEDDDDSEPASP